MKKSNWAVMATMAMFLSTAFLGGIAGAAQFHITASADSLSSDTADGYVGSSISQVTRELESPSMVRDNLTDSSKIDYIYIGNSAVYTFEVSKEAGKPIVSVYSDGREAWESGVYPGYPAK